MPHGKKQLHITRQGHNTPETREAETIEKALRDLARDIKNGEVVAPFHLSFEGPSGLTFNIDVATDEQATEFSTMGFMF